MPRTDVVLYKDVAEAIPLTDWLDSIPKRARTKCVAALARLQQLGHELRRPEADYLRDGIYELRVRLGSVNYRMLYFFHGRKVAIVSHGCTKSRRVPPREIETAIDRRARYLQNPRTHTFKPDGTG